MPQQYTPVEYANMHFIYGLCNGNANRAANVYRDKYPNARHPDYRVFIRVHNAFMEGRFPGTGIGGASEGRPQRHNAAEVLEIVAEDPDGKKKHSSESSDSEGRKGTDRKKSSDRAGRARRGRSSSSN